MATEKKDIDASVAAAKEGGNEFTLAVTKMVKRPVKFSLTSGSATVNAQVAWGMAWRMDPLAKQLQVYDINQILCAGTMGVMAHIDPDNDCSWTVPGYASWATVKHVMPVLASKREWLFKNSTATGGSLKFAQFHEIVFSQIMESLTKMKKNPAEIAYVTSFYVEKQYEQQGLSRQLLDKLLEQAKAAGMKGMVVMETNPTTSSLLGEVVSTETTGNIKRELKEGEIRIVNKHCSLYGVEAFAREWVAVWYIPL